MTKVRSWGVRLYGIRARCRLQRRPSRTRSPAARTARVRHHLAAAPLETGFRLATRQWAERLQRAGLPCHNQERVGGDYHFWWGQQLPVALAAGKAMGTGPLLLRACPLVRTDIWCEGATMRSPSRSRRYTRRVCRYVQSFPILAIAACAALVVVAGCSNGGAPLTQDAPPTVAQAAPGVPLYSVEARNLGFDAMPSLVPANWQFQLSILNDELFTTTDDLVVLRLPPGKTAQMVVDDAKQKGVKAENDWVDVGGTDPLPVGASGVLTLDLRPGNYVATSWATGKAGGGTGPPHVALGMIAPFTASVAVDTEATAAPSGPMYSVSVKNFTFVGMPATVPANRPIAVTFINDDAFSIKHEFVVLWLPPGDTAQTVVDDAIKKGDKAEDDWKHYADTGAALPIGASAVVRMNLPPGNYVATCWQTGKEGGGTGHPHVMIGMITPFTAVKGG